MRKHPWRILTFIVIILFPVFLFACAWDYDTLMMERMKFPGTLELITGKFLRHSKEFYDWRVKDRLTKIKNQPNRLEFYDDLGVAYDKLGQHDKAIATMLDKDHIKPGLYETEANLGTFYIHNQQLETGLSHIKRAIEINPDAHFGREIYQQKLVEYILSIENKGIMRLPLSKSISFQEDTLSNENSSLQTDESAYNFVTWLWPGVDHVPESERRNAIKGISGMLKFGNHESPILLEVLGNLLCNCNYRFSENDRNMAARAYLRASYLVDDEQSRLDYQELASSVLDMQRRHPYSSQSVTLKATEHALKADILDAQQWYEQVKENELKWIAAGKNVDDEFTRMYYSEPVSIDTQGQYWKLIPWLLGLGCIFIPLCISLPVIWLIRFGNRALSKSFPNIETTSTKKTT